MTPDILFSAVESFTIHRISWGRFLDASVKAVSRNIDSLNKFDLLNGCDFFQADALNPDSLLPSVVASDCLVISVETTAFPSFVLPTVAN